MTLYLVTGGAGFIGSNIVERLVGEGERACPEQGRRERSRRVRVLDNFATGKRENLAPWLDCIELIEGDIRDPETVKRAMKGWIMCCTRPPCPQCLVRLPTR